MKLINPFDIVGKKNHRLTILRFIEKQRRDEKKNLGYYYFYKCKCDCGREVIINRQHLVTKNQKSCGCLKEINGLRKPKGEASFNSVYLSYKHSAKRRKIDFFLTKEEFKKVTQQNCFYCGASPSHIYYTNCNFNGDYVFNGIDRVNNKKGYIFKNCAPCCKQCNMAKGVLSVLEFKKWIKTIYEYSFVT